MSESGWVLDENIRATVMYVSERRTDLLIERIHHPGACLLAIRDGRLLINGEDHETEDFMAYLGLFDHVSEHAASGDGGPQVGDSVVIEGDTPAPESKSVPRVMDWVEILFDLREARPSYEPEHSLSAAALTTQLAFEFLLGVLPVFDLMRVYPELVPSRNIGYLKADDWGVVRYHSTDQAVLRSLVNAANDTAGEVSYADMSFDW